MKSDKILDYFAKNTQGFDRIAKSLHKRPTEKNVHKLRIATRRLRSVIKFLGNNSGHKNLKKLARILGKQRDLDVAMINAGVFKLDDSKLIRLQKKQSKKTQDYLKNKRVNELSKELHTVEKIIEKHPSIDLKPSLSSLKKELLQWKKKRLEEKDLHSFRIMMKKVRYVLEATGKPIGNLKMLQDTLGQIHDLQVLRDCLGKDKKVEKVKEVKSKKAIRLSREAIQASLLKLNQIH